jgi:hypothetical protein
MLSGVLHLMLAMRYEEIWLRGHILVVLLRVRIGGRTALVGHGRVWLLGRVVHRLLKL